MVQLPVPMPASHLYNNKRGPGSGQVPGSSIGNNNINGHIGIGSTGVLHGGVKNQGRQPFLQRLPSRIHDLTRAIEIAVSGANTAAQQQQQQQQRQRQHAQAKQTSLKSKPSNNRQASSKKLQQSEKV